MRSAILSFAALNLIFFSNTALLAQIFSNPSFEGTPQANIPPTGWSPCNQFSTPDTQPGFWNLAFPAAHGATYLSLVARGNLGPYANTVEAVEGKLQTALIQGKDYRVSVDLAFSKDWGHTIDFGGPLLLYDTPVRLRVYGGRTSCDKRQVLWESPVIDHTNWKTYDMILKSGDGNVDYIVFETVYVSTLTYFGNILIDNLRVDPCSLAQPIVTIPFDKAICPGDVVLLDATTPGGTYVWSNGPTTPSITVNRTDTYTVTVSNGCVSQVFPFVISEADCSCEIHVPNVLTPNNDGLNDTFRITGSPLVARFQLKVINRWGGVVFTSDTMDTPWNGRVNGDINPGVYYWTATIQCISNKTIVDNFYRGWVSVLN